MSQQQKRLFLSDVHVGGKRYSEESNGGKYKFDWDWLSEAETENFVQFLDFLEKDTVYSDSVREVILLGDIFDNWIFPHDITPPSMSQLIEAKENLRVRAALETLSARHRVFFVPGNHDMAASPAFIRRYFPNITYCPEQFQAGRLVAEHGHRYAMFNAPAGFSENLYGLPLGYFISRMEATRKAVTNEGGRNYRTYVDDFLELCTKDTLPQCVFEAVLEETGLHPEEEFVVRTFADQVVRVPASRIRETYQNVYEDWNNAVVSKPRAVMAELDRLDPVADTICKKGQFQVCVLGHSHKGEIDKDSWFCVDRIYANSGYWCESKCTFVEVENKYCVRLVRWDGSARRVEVLDEKSI